MKFVKKKKKIIINKNKFKKHHRDSAKKSCKQDESNAPVDSEFFLFSNFQKTKTNHAKLKFEQLIHWCENLPVAKNI